MTEKIASPPPDGSPIGSGIGGSEGGSAIQIVGHFGWLQFWSNVQRGLNLLLGPSFLFTSYLEADLPTPGENTGGQVYVSDLAVMAYDNGTNWLNLTTGAVII